MRWKGSAGVEKEVWSMVIEVAARCPGLGHDPMVSSLGELKLKSLSFSITGRRASIRSSVFHHVRNRLTRFGAFCGGAASVSGVPIFNDDNLQTLKSGTATIRSDCANCFHYGIDLSAETLSFPLFSVYQWHLHTFGSASCRHCHY